MNVIFLCAGYATRLYPLTENKPKPLLPIGGRPILEWIFDKVQEIKTIKKAFVVSNHRFASHFDQWAKGYSSTIPIKAIDDQTTSNENRLGAIGDLNYVLKQEKIENEDLLVVAGDNFFDFNLNQFIAFAASKRPHASIAVYDVQDLELAKQYGLVAANAEGQVTAFFEKPKNPTTTLASCGLYWLPKETMVLLDRYLTSGNNPDQPGHFMRWLSENDQVFAARLEGHWLDIGDKASYEKANVLFRELQSKKS